MFIGCPRYRSSGGSPARQPGEHKKRTPPCGAGLASRFLLLGRGVQLIVFGSTLVLLASRNLDDDCDWCVASGALALSHQVSALVALVHSVHGGSPLNKPIQYQYMKTHTNLKIRQLYRLSEIPLQWREVSAAMRLSRPTLNIDRPHRGRPPQGRPLPH